MREILTDKRMRRIREVAQRLRYLSLWSTTEAGSGHPTSCLSAADIAATLFFGGHFFHDTKHASWPNNDRFILSKGHAAPLLYACAAVAGDIPEKALKTLRKDGSKLQGHPMPGSPWAEVPTGSLGQGLAIGVGMALANRYDNVASRVFVLMGDSELAEGSVWEAVQFAGFQRLHHLVAMVDVNGLGQRGQTMWGHHTGELARRFSASGWRVLTVDGHSFTELDAALTRARKTLQPTVILAKTEKGFGVPFLNGKQGWHGKALTREQFIQAQQWIPNEPLSFKPSLSRPVHHTPAPSTNPHYEFPVLPEIPIAGREAIGLTLGLAAGGNKNLYALDGEVGNSTDLNAVAQHRPHQFIEGYIAEQLISGMATGLAARGKLPVLATFGAFWTRAHDQIRMAGYAGCSQVYIGTHAGISIGQDGPSQMALEDISLFRSTFNTTVLAAADDVSAARLTHLALKNGGLTYLRALRAPMPRLYETKTSFVRGGSHTLRTSKRDVATIIAHGATVHEALQAAKALSPKRIRVIDAYSIQPLDTTTIRRAAEETEHIVVVEDHGRAGGLGEAVAAVVAGKATFSHLAVDRVPHSGTPEHLLAWAGIDAASIAKHIRSIV